MKEFHCIVGNKGGVGKSLAASLVTQYAEDQRWGPFGIECDQSNRTLSRYERLRTQRLELLDSEQQIDRRRFDTLIEMLVQDDEPFVVMDNGQASFAPLTRYMVECHAFDT
ncbi:MAG: conjugal transfer protein TraL, partial [Myxococcales bacterium]|nr:conjugal transfer protein TraL [Myxococcales bacterium]